MNNKINVFGFSIINSAGFSGGNESNSYLFSSQEECLSEAFKSYQGIWNEALSDGVLDQDKCLSFNEFVKTVSEQGYAYIQCYDSHVQFECFAKELELDLNKSITFVDKEQSEMEQNGLNDKDKYPHLFNTRDFDILKKALFPAGLHIIDNILNAYYADKIDIEVVRNADGQIEFDKSGGLIINDENYVPNGFESLVIKWVEDMEDTGYMVECFGEYSKSQELDQAVQVVDKVCSQQNGNKIFGIANIVYSLKAEGVLSDDEILKLTERIYEATYASAAPLLTAERVDAVLYLAVNGINTNRFPDLPEATPEQITEFMLTCDFEIFLDLVEKVAVDNQTFYLPDDIGLDREEAVERALLDFVNKKPTLDAAIAIADKKADSRSCTTPTISGPEL